MSITAVRPSRWLLPQADEPGTAALARELHLQLPAARVLWNRGYRTAVDALRFLKPGIEHLHDPRLLADMDAAVTRLAAAIRNRERVLLYGDYDVDGTTSVVILKKAIELAGGIADFHVPHRVKDGYGMRPEVIDRAAAEGVRLVVSVDTGIRARAVVEHAQTLGIDVIVTDHHLPEESLPPALAVINPNRPDCQYPDKNLCGAGVAFKLVQALLVELDFPAERALRLLESFLKLVAIATVADVVPLTGENRVIVKTGLDGLNRVANPGLRALLRVAGFAAGARPTARQVAFQIAPRINAAGRMANASDVIRMFLTSDEAEATSLATQLHDLNKERQDTEAEIVACILEECVQHPVNDDQAALVFFSDGWHKGVVGIVASRIVERFHRPVFVLSGDAETGLAQGSGRSIRTFHLLDALEAMPGLFHKFGGHRQAAGLTLDSERVPEFRERLNRYAQTLLSPEDFRPTTEIDATISLAEINDASVADVLSLAPFGCGNPAPVFAVIDAEVATPPVIWKDKHLRVALKHQGRTIFAKAWNFAGRISEVAPGQRLDFAVTIEDDPYVAAGAGAGWCLVLRDVRESQYRNSAATGALSGISS